MINHPLDRCGNCERVSRAEIKLCDYNPRTITPERKRRLKALLEEHGLCKPLIWNKRSGNLIEGHQRISVLDTLVDSKEWAVPVIIHDVDDVKEREMNIAFNGADAQGEYELSKLGKMFTDYKLDISATGFDAGKLKTLIPNVAVSIPEVATQIAVNKQHWQESHKKTQARQDAAVDRMAERAKDFTPQTTEVAKPADRAEANIYETDDLFYIPFVFPDLMAATRIKTMMGLPEESRDQDGRILMQIVQEWIELKARK